MTPQALGWEKRWYKCLKSLKVGTLCISEEHWRSKSLQKSNLLLSTVTNTEEFKESTFYMLSCKVG